MGNSECEMDVGDGPEEEPELDEGDTDTPPSPIDDQIQGNGHPAKDNKTPNGDTSGNANGNGEAATPRSQGKPLARTANDALSTRSSNGIKKFKVPMCFKLIFGRWFLTC